MTEVERRSQELLAWAMGSLMNTLIGKNDFECCPHCGSILGETIMLVGDDQTDEGVVCPEGCDLR